MDLCPQFVKTVSSSALLKRFSGVVTIDDLYDCFNESGIGFANREQLLSATRQYNHLITIPNSEFYANWFPCEYQVKDQTIRWCLLPEKMVHRPFFDDAVSVVNRRNLVNSVLQPKTSLHDLVNSSLPITQRNPNGFIFHLSRCGSTLISNAFAASGDCGVISESSVLREILLDDRLDTDIQINALQKLITLQSRCYGEEGHLVIKLNAWDIKFFSLIKKAYPEVPVTFIIREPETILLSHNRSSGIHMVPNNSRVSALFSGVTETDLHRYRISVLEILMGQMLDALKQSHDSKVMVIDYSQITSDKIKQLATHFNMPMNDEQLESVRQDMKRYSKEPDRSYQGDHYSQQLTVDTKQQIENCLTPLYKETLAIISALFSATQRG